MEIPPQLIDRVSELVRRRNRELAFDAALKAGLGIVFSVLTFGTLFWFGWVVGFFVGHSLGTYPWQLGSLVAGVFFVVATWSAWRHVDPLAGLEPLTDGQMLLTLIGQATGAFTYFSPRHATAGAALMLLGGPANVIEAFGIWAHRHRADAELIEQAARLLVLCREELPVDEVRIPAAAFLLRRLALIKVLPRGDSAVIAPTDKGLAMLPKQKSRPTGPI
jgi:hypothetical protein